MNQREAVINVMEKNGGYATLGYLYENTLKVPNVIWKTKTPYASIRRIVQDEKYFFKIQPGLWALNDFRDKLPNEVSTLIEDKLSDKNREMELSTHSFYQGLIIELGKMKGYKTYIPPQDHNKAFLKKSTLLKDLVDYNRLLTFTYDDIVQIVKYIDVFWFNDRNFPSVVFEIDHTTNFRNSLVKFIELQDFELKMVIVSSKHRLKDFEKKIARPIFEPIKEKVKFYSYDYVSQWHSDAFKLKNTENGFSNLR